MLVLTCSDPVPQHLKANDSSADKQEKTSFINDEAKFRWALFDDNMAFDKLHEGIRGFAKDGNTLKDMLKQKIQA